MIKVNLVPAEVLIAEQKKRRMVQAAAGGVVLLVVLGLISLVHWNTARGLEARLKVNEEELAKLQKVVDQVKQLEATAKNVKARLEVVVSLHKNRFVYTVFMEDWIRSMPSGIWLSSLNTSVSGNSVSVQMGGGARTKEDVAEWLRTLEGDKKYSNVILGDISMSGAPPTAVFSFTLKTVYGFTPPPEVGAQAQ